MERLIMFHLTSIFEWITLITFALTMFRYPIRTHWHKIGVGSLFMTEFSYILRDILGLVELSPAIQIIVLVIFFMLLFRIRFLFAAIMVTFGYLGVFNIQTALLITLKKMSYFTNENILESYAQLYVLSAVSTITIFTVCYLLAKYRIGFTYEPERDVKLTFRQKLIYIGFLFLSAILFALTLYFYDRISIELFVFLCIGAMYYMFGFILKKEMLLASRYSGKME